MHAVREIDRLVRHQVPAAQARRPAPKQVAGIASRLGAAADQRPRHAPVEPAQLQRDRLAVHVGRHQPKHVLTWRIGERRNDGRVVDATDDERVPIELHTRNESGGGETG